MVSIPASDLRAAIAGLRQGTGRQSRYSAMLNEAVDELEKLRLLATDLVCEICHSIGDDPKCECGSTRTPRLMLEARELEEKIHHLERVIQEFMDTDSAAGVAI